MPSWSAEEVEQLKRGVLKHGRGKWSQILKDPELRFVAGRKPVSLRDKFEYMARNYPQGNDNRELMGHSGERQLQALSLPEPETGFRNTPRGINANHAASSSPITARPYNEATRVKGIYQISQNRRDFLQHPIPLYAWTQGPPEWLNHEFSSSLARVETPVVALNDFGEVLGTSNTWLDKRDRYPDLDPETNLHLETQFISSMDTDDFAMMFQDPFWSSEIFSIQKSGHWRCN